MDRLQQILQVKKQEIQRLLPVLDDLRKAALQREDFRCFSMGLDQGEGALGLIAEVKKASPSAGDIVDIFDPVLIAKDYEYAGANAISVLTDETFFKGHIAYLRDIRDVTSIPLLRKDFIIHEAQVYEAVVAGADALLLIVAALDQPDLVRLHALATACQLEVLVEVHSLEELDRALAMDARIIGINNRNLKTFEVNLETSELLSEQVPDDVILVSESGIKTNADSHRLIDAGFNAILVGETLMTAYDVRAKVFELTGMGLAHHDEDSSFD